MTSHQAHHHRHELPPHHHPSQLDDDDSHEPTLAIDPLTDSTAGPGDSRPWTELVRGADPEQRRLIMQEVLTTARPRRRAALPARDPLAPAAARAPTLTTLGPAPVPASSRGRAAGQADDDRVQRLIDQHHAKLMKAITRRALHARRNPDNTTTPLQDLANQQQARVGLLQKEAAWVARVRKQQQRAQQARTIRRRLHDEKQAAIRLEQGHAELARMSASQRMQRQASQETIYRELLQQCVAEYRLRVREVQMSRVSTWQCGSGSAYRRQPRSRQ